VTDYPDWQAQPLWRGVNLFPALNSVFAPGVTPTPVFPVTHWAWVLLRVLPSAGYGKVTASWWLDQAGTMGVGQDTWPVSTNTGLLVVIPGEGNFVSVTVNNTSGGAMSAVTYLAGTNATTGKKSYPVTDDVSAALAFSIPASGFQKFYRGWINRGDGRLWIDPHDALGKVNYQLVTEDETGAAVAEVLNVVGPTSSFSAVLPLPDQIMSLHVTNTDAGAPHVFDYSLYTADA
jgi:hypothetical protein